MSKAKHHSFILTVPKRDGVSEADWKAYILDAVGSMKGCYSPNDPIFGFDSDDVQVKRDVKTGMVDTLHKEIMEWRELVNKLNAENQDLRQRLKP
jgi:hypothetical protein